MGWAGKKHPVERAVEWLAPIPLAASVAWASACLGLAEPLALALGSVVLVAGCYAMRVVGGDSIALPSFEPAEFESTAPGELLLEEMDSVLELNDPLVAAMPDSRVVRLFARDEPTPGEMVDRIVGFLAEGRRLEPAGQSSTEGVRPDASAALHEALANIRASLR